MRLDPVYLVAPEPSKRPTRRAFMLTSGTLLAGFSLGGACGYAAGSRAGANDAENQQALEPTGDAELDELRELSRNGSIEELLAARFKIRHFVITRYPDDPVLWTGIERLARIVLQRPDCPDRRPLARGLGTMIEQSGKPAEHLIELVPRLKSVQ